MSHEAPSQTQSMTQTTPVEGLPFLRPSHKRALQNVGGFTSVGEVVDACRDPDALASRCGLVVEEAAWILEALSHFTKRPALLSLSEVLEEENRRDSSRLATFSKDLDAILGGGVPMGSLTELCGAPGVGKTQIAMQLCVSCFLPPAFGGLTASVEGTGPSQSQVGTSIASSGVGCLFIDTEGSFVGSRYREIASAAVAQVTRIANQSRWQMSLTSEELEAMRAEAAAFTVDRVLRGTNYVRVTSLVDMLSMIQSLPALLQENRHWKLIVIDSVAFPIRGASSGGLPGAPALDPLQVSRIAFHMGQLLQQVGHEHHVCVVVTNQMTTKPHFINQQRVSELVPALGDAWAHTVSTRIVLRAPRVPVVTYSEAVGASQLRVAELRKSPTEVRGQCSFVVCSAGIRNSTGLQPAIDDANDEVYDHDA